MMRMAVLVACVLGPSLAWADDLELSIDNAKVLVGQGEPTLLLTVARPVKVLELQLVRNDGQKLVKKTGALAAGKVFKTGLGTTAGAWDWKGEVRVTFQDGGAGEMPIGFHVDVVGPLEMSAPVESVDLVHGRVLVKVSRPIERCDYDVSIDDKANRRGSTQVSDDRLDVLVDLPIASDDLVLKIEITCFDANGFYRGIALYPWRLEVPHEEVNFASGDSRIDAAETSKLETALADIDKAVRRYGQLVKIKLYLVGHTDTVGEAGSNLALSRARARAIGEWLRKKGVRVPISYAGLGESSPLVSTADETAEAKNRRAQYILAVEAPLNADWQGL